MSELSTRAGFVAVVGAPNAGKSTLVNGLVGSKVSIVSPKVQTTRMRVIGIAMADMPDGTRAQVVLVDTPGIFRVAKRRLERAMVAAAWQGAEDAEREIEHLGIGDDFGGRGEAADNIAPVGVGQRDLQHETDGDHRQKHDHKRFHPAKAEPLKIEDEEDVERRDHDADFQGNAEQ